MSEFRPVLSARGALVFAAHGDWKERDCRGARLLVVATQHRHGVHHPEPGEGPPHQVPEHVPRLAVTVEHVLEALDAPTVVGPDGSYFYDLRIPPGAELSLLPEGVAPGSDEAKAYASRGWELDWVGGCEPVVSPYDSQGNELHPDTALDWIPSSNELEVETIDASGVHATIAPAPGRVRCRQIVLTPAPHRAAAICQLSKDGEAKARHAVGDVVEIEGLPLRAPLCLWGLREGRPIALHPGAASSSLRLSISAMPGELGDPAVSHFGLYGAVFVGRPRLGAVLSSALHPSFVCPPLAHFSDAEPS